MIKLVAFDLDGTIGDTIPMCISAFKKAVTPYTNHELTEKEIIQTFGLNEEGMIRQVITGDNWQEALDDFYDVYKKMHAIKCPHPFEGIAKLIGELKKKSIVIALVTGKGKKSCIITLKQFNMEGCFDCIKTGSSERNRKAEHLNNLLVEYSLQPYEMVYIGDTVSDVMACQKIGIKCLSAVWATSDMDICEIKEHNKEHLFYSVESLRFFLTESFESL